MTGDEVDLVDEKAKDAPVYDDRGNVRPRGTKGARPMTFEERVEIARSLGNGGEPVGDEPPAATPEDVRPEPTSAGRSSRSRSK